MNYLRSLLLGSFLILAGACSIGPLVAQESVPKDYSILVHAQTEKNPARIHLQWPQGRWVTGYHVFRKKLPESQWQHLADLPGDATSYTDSSVGVGEGYEYQLTKDTSRGFPGYGYIYAGIEVPSTEHRGTVVLVEDAAHADALAAELDQWVQDVQGDGWLVARKRVASTDSPAHVRGLIQEVYAADPDNVKAVFLFGRIPVPYSGDIFPDQHENHRGAWPADVYYGDMDGEWTDSTVDRTTAEREVNWNVPGDGKFDQDMPPTGAEVAVGRVDFWNMTNFSNKEDARSERDLLRRYLQKNHAWRVGNIEVRQRALIADNFGEKGWDPAAGSAWRSFPAFFGPDGIDEVGWNEYFPSTTESSYLWSYGSGGGTYYISHGIGTSDDFALKDVQVVFSMWLGSYLGDWNNESNFLRAALGSGHILTSSYSGFPHWYYHPMALGETIGFCTLLSQNNREGGTYPPFNQGSGMVHIALMGDPTLRMHVVKPVLDLQGSVEGGSVKLDWQASTEPDLTGYHVYRRDDDQKPFARATDAPVAETQWTDQPGNGTFEYMVRTVKLESNSSGSYFNLSQGTKVTATVSIDLPEPPAMPSDLRVETAEPRRVVLHWTDQSSSETGFQVQRAVGTEAFSTVFEPAAGVTVWQDEGVQPDVEYRYQVRAVNDAGASDWAGPISVRTPPEKVDPGEVLFAPPVLEGNALVIRLAEAYEGEFVLERSTDFDEWTTVEQEPLGAAPLEWSVEIQDEPRVFYRVKLAN